jgi:hypoxanthine phosphoribosyltransferase
MLSPLILCLSLNDHQDEVDDTRKTLQSVRVIFIRPNFLLTSHLSYALSELQKDVEAELLTRPESERAALRDATKFGIFVVHNKDKAKLAELPPGTP